MFNWDETAVFYRALPERTLAVKGTDCYDGKRSKERLSVVLLCSGTGEMITPVVIGKSQQPRCFKNLNIDDLPVIYKANKKAWMVSSIFEESVKSLDKKIRAQNQVLLFLDNASSHPSSMELTNVKLVFFPPNTTSKLQPLDQGIIENFKLHYKNRLLQRVLVAVNRDNATSSSVVKCVELLDACNWITAAAKKVTTETMTKLVACIIGNAV